MDTDIEERFRVALLRYVGKCTPEFFDDSCTKSPPYLSEFLGWLRLGSHRDEADRILKVVARAKLPKGISFAFRRGERSHRNIPEIHLELVGEVEWEDARAEARSLLEVEEPSAPSKAGDVLDWVRRQKEPRFVSLDEIDSDLRLGQLKDIVCWLRLHREPRLALDTRRGGLVRLSLEESPSSKAEPPLNPVMWEMPENPNFQGLQEARRFFEEIILASGRGDDSRPLRVLHVDTRKEVKRCFPFVLPRWPEYRFDRFLAQVPAILGIEISYSFEGKAGPWTLSLHLLDGTWADAIRAIRAARDEVPLEQRYGLSGDAARVLRWLQGLPPRRLFHGLSPTVEDHIEVEIGLDDSKWEGNHATMLGLLAEEISEKTPYRVRTVHWQWYAHPRTRLRISPRLNLTEELAERLRIHAASQGKSVTLERARDLLQSLLE